MAPRGFGSLPAQDARGVQGLPDIRLFRHVEGYLGTSKVTPPHAEAIDSKAQYCLWKLVTYALRLGTFEWLTRIAVT